MSQDGPASHRERIPPPPAREANDTRATAVITAGWAVALIVLAALRGSLPPDNYSTVDVISLYWHLVDAIWLFLMPLLYLAGAGMHH